MDPQVIELMKIWWNEVEQKSRRDQLSFNYGCQKKLLQYDVSELKCWKSPYWMNLGIHTSDIRAVEKEQELKDISKRLEQAERDLHILRKMPTGQMLKLYRKIKK